MGPLLLAIMYALGQAAVGQEEHIQLKNTLAHLETDRLLVVANRDYPKQNCVGFRFFRAADMCTDFDRIGFLVSMLSCCLLSERGEG